MKILKMPRAAGKTYKLITLSAERNAYIVCRDKKDAERVFQMALDRDLVIPFPITFGEFKCGEYYGKGIKEMLIDDVDQLLIFLAEVNISYATYTPA